MKDLSVHFLYDAIHLQWHIQYSGHHYGTPLPFWNLSLFSFLHLGHLSHGYFSGSVTIWRIYWCRRDTFQNLPSCLPTRVCWCISQRTASLFCPVQRRGRKVLLQEALDGRKRGCFQSTKELAWDSYQVWEGRLHLPALGSEETPFKLLA